MSALRPTLTSGSTKPCMKDGTAYLLIYRAVEQSGGLIHGKLHARGEHCAIRQLLRAARQHITARIADR